MTRQDFIGGSWTLSVQGPTFPVVDPATGVVADEIPAGGAAEADAAVSAARKAAPEWARTTAAERASALKAAAQAVRASADELADLQTTENGKPLGMSRGDVDLVLHTGSIATGRRIAEACGRRLKKAVLELGGKDPLIVDGDVDPRWAAEQAAQSAFANCGQICTAVERIYVHADVADAFVDALADRAEDFVVGDGRDPKTQMGPLVDGAQRDFVHRHVREAVDAGASLRAGGRMPDGPGFVYPPTVLSDVTDDMVVMREETFGPVAPVQVTASFTEAVQAANGTEYGLATTVLTRSQAHAQQAMRDLRAGTVKVNAVWGGAPGGAAEPQKASGLGYGYGPELLDEVTTTKVVHHRPAAGAP